MRIAAESTIAASERALMLLAESTPDERLKLPTNVRHLVGGAEAGLAQLIITWAQGRPTPTLETFLSTDEQAADFVRRLPGIVAALCASEAFGTQTDVSIFEVLRASAFARLGQLQSARPQHGFRGSSAEIVCADHLGRDSPYLLYAPDSRGGFRIRPRENFAELARWLLRKAIPAEYHAMVDPEAADAIGGMLFELFKNTEDHALVDARGDLLDISIRAIKTNHHGVRPNDLARIVEEFGPLATYCNTLQPPKGAVQAHLFELSILDSGPGYAVTHEGRPLDEISPDDEERAVRECFGRSTAKRESRFGEGLPHVLRLLRRQKGFLRLRTGRLSFYADFSASTVQDDLQVLRRHQPDQGKGLAPVAGSLLTILIPMRRQR